MFSTTPPFTFCFFFFFNDTATTEIYTLSLHDALPILWRVRVDGGKPEPLSKGPTMEWTPVELSDGRTIVRSEEHTSELQSRLHLVCRLLLEKKKKERL